MDGVDDNFNPDDDSSYIVELLSLGRKQTVITGSVKYLTSSLSDLTYNISRFSEEGGGGKLRFLLVELDDREYESNGGKVCLKNTQ